MDALCEGAVVIPDSHASMETDPDDWFWHLIRRTCVFLKVQFDDLTPDRAICFAH